MFVPPDTGPVGWFPLAPGEVYWPSYTATRDREFESVLLHGQSVANLTSSITVGADGCHCDHIPLEER
jgi:hypothetical protein